MFVLGGVPYDIFFVLQCLPYEARYLIIPQVLANFEAKVVSVGWEADCAVLTVENDEFWQDIKAVQLSKKAWQHDSSVVEKIQCFKVYQIYWLL